MWRKAGYRFGVVTHRSSHIVKMRVAELEVDILRQGIDDKLAAMRGIVGEFGLTPAQVCYIGDDLPDLRTVQAAGLGVAVADACAELARRPTTRGLPGGAGAVREASS